MPGGEWQGGMSDEEDDGQEIRDFPFVFETHTEITKAWKKEVCLTDASREGSLWHC